MLSSIIINIIVKEVRSVIFNNYEHYSSIIINIIVKEVRGVIFNNYEHYSQRGI